MDGTICIYQNNLQDDWYTPHSHLPSGNLLLFDPTLRPSSHDPIHEAVSANRADWYSKQVGSYQLGLKLQA